MSMSLAELDAQDVKLLPERATLHRGGSRITIVSSTRRPSPASLTSVAPSTPTWPSRPSSTCS